MRPGGRESAREEDAKTKDEGGRMKDERAGVGSQESEFRKSEKQKPEGREGRG